MIGRFRYNLVAIQKGAPFFGALFHGGGDVNRSSRIPGFYKKSIEERVKAVADWAGLSPEEQAILRQGLGLAQADKMIENVVGVFSLPLGIGVNFLINGRDYLIPMVVEEPSVVAAVSNVARMAREGGGFQTGSTEPLMIAQVQLLDVPDIEKAAEAIRSARDELLAIANQFHPTIQRLGGGAKDVAVRVIEDTSVGTMLIVHLIYDTRDAMGANALNTAAEAIAPKLESLTGGRALLRILSNYSTLRRAWARVRIPPSAFGEGETKGKAVIRGIVAANAFAEADVYRAVTHNKGIMNGIDAVVMATGNDWRAVEAAAHAYAAKDGRYRSLTEWRESEDGSLEGYLELPMALGIVGGATRSHPQARVALKILGVRSAQELAEVVVAVGLAQNLAAIRALADEGIQKGHMSLHARQLALAAGARDDEVDAVAERLVQSGQIREETAREIIAEMRARN